RHLDFPLIRLLETLKILLLAVHDRTDEAYAAAAAVRKVLTTAPPLVDGEMEAPVAEAQLVSGERRADTAGELLDSGCPHFGNDDHIDGIAGAGNDVDDVVVASRDVRGVDSNSAG